MLFRDTDGCECHVNPRYIESAFIDSGVYCVTMISCGDVYERYEVDDDTYGRVVAYLDNGQTDVQALYDTACQIIGRLMVGKSDISEVEANWLAIERAGRNCGCKVKDHIRYL